MKIFFKQSNNQTIKQLLIVIAFIFFSGSVSAQISVSSSGAVKLAGDMNIDPYYNSSRIYPDEDLGGYLGLSNQRFSMVYTYGIDGTNYYANGVRFQSDKRLKENFRTIDSPLNKLLQLDGLKYDYILEGSDSLGTDKEKQKKSDLKKNRLGFVAQDVEKYLPEVVYYDSETDKYYIEYTAIIPVIVEAMKEQQTKINVLEEEISTLKNDANLKSATLGVEETIEKAATLGQNIPNPFSETSRIDIYLPQNVNKAVLYVYNMQGVQIKSFPLTERGNTNVTIEGSSLKAGMYMYTLIADGKEVDTKKMILTK